jgi:type III secretion system FlhB-like substrate exporter
MKNFTPELIAKAKATKSAEELFNLAKENSVEITREEAEAQLSRKY